jgi:hypothetical protein
VKGPIEPRSSPWANEADAADALQDFSRAAQQLITQGRPREQLRDVERLAVELALALGAIFINAPDDAFAGKLRKALSQLQGPTFGERRALAVRAIVQWAPAWQQADDRNRPWVLEQLVQQLSLIDAAFRDVNIESLGEKLAAYHPAAERNPGTVSAESILAKLITQDCDALGLTSDPNEPEQDELERIRKLLSPSVDEPAPDSTAP